MSRNAFAHLVTVLLFGFLLTMTIREARGDEPAPIVKCAALAGDYSRNPFALSLEQLDQLRLCITGQIAATVQEREDAKTDRAIWRNFSKLEDAE